MLRGLTKDLLVSRLVLTWPSSIVLVYWFLSRLYVAVIGFCWNLIEIVFGIDLISDACV